MLEENLKAQLKGYLERLTQPVEIIASLGDSGESRDMLEAARGHRLAVAVGDARPGAR